VTGPLDNEVWGGEHAGVYLVKACAITKVGRCRLPISKPVLKAHMVSALEAII